MTSRSRPPSGPCRVPTANPTPPALTPLSGTPPSYARLTCYSKLHFEVELTGEEFPMAMHLLHKSRSGQLLALVVLFRLGAENPALKALLPHIPTGADGDHLIADAVADPGALLPARKAYYRYDGSLTASPCTEGVTWLVMRQPLELSPEQLRHWRTRFADNIRPP